MAQQDGKSRILVVDDQEATLEILTWTLEKAGYRVLTENRGAKALETIRRAEPDLLLLDICMPEMDGFEVCRQLRAQPRRAEVPVIFISSLSETAEKVKAFDLGAVDYLQKPVRPAELLARVRTHLSLRSMRAQLEARNADLQESRRVLEERVAERTAGIEEALHRLRAEELRRVEAENRAMRAIEAEQTRIGQDIHDGLVQHLSGIAFLCEALETELAGEGSRHLAALRRIHGLLSESAVQARGVARGLCPVGLETAGLASALEKLVGVSHEMFPEVRIDFVRDGRLGGAVDSEPDGLDKDAQIQLYRIVQEALHNAIKHSGAGRIVVSMSEMPGGLQLAVEDDGRGLPAEAGRGDGMGMSTMSYRAARLGASFSASAGASRGTRIEVRMDSEDGDEEVSR